MNKAPTSGELPIIKESKQDIKEEEKESSDSDDTNRPSTSPMTKTLFKSATLRFSKMNK